MQDPRFGEEGALSVSYQVGIDLGTTYTAAAVFRDGAATIFTLGTRNAAIPSVVLLREDGTILTGDAAERRAMSEPERVVREFKRRLGDTTPLIVGGKPHTAEALTAMLLRSVIDDVRAREGGEPSRIVITHPANWGTYKRDLLKQAVSSTGLDASVVGFLTEPEAAALSYAAQERIDPGEVVAVYDLGGGTFDAAVLRRTPEGFSVLGKPEGIERLGGIDFDAAVFSHVTGGLGTALAELDREDPAALAAMARLRQDCVEAKEALSSDTDATIPVLLPNFQTEVRITRQEFETLVRPSLFDSIDGMKRAVESAGIEMSEVSRVLLVGGSSRIPLVSLMVTSELGRPVAVDAHPKHAIAIGAAFAASGILEDSADAPVPPPVDRPIPRGADPNMTIIAPAHLYNPGTGSGKPLPIETPSGRTIPDRSTPAAAPAAPSRSLPVEKPAAASPRGLPIEKPSAAPRPDVATPPRALPVEKPAAAVPPRALPLENPPSALPNPAPASQPASRPVPGPAQAVPPGKAKPVQGLRPPPSGPPPATPQPATPPAAAPPQTPQAAPGSDNKPTSLYRAPGELDRTQVYPDGAPPSYDRAPAPNAGFQNPSPGQPGLGGGGQQALAPQPKKRSGLVWFLMGLVLVALIVVGIIVAGALG